MQNYFLHSRPRSGLGTQTGGMGGVSPPYKFAVFLLKTKEIRLFIRGVYTPRAPRLGSPPRQSRRGGNGGDQFQLFRPSLRKLCLSIVNYIELVYNHHAQLMRMYR